MSSSEYQDLEEPDQVYTEFKQFNEAPPKQVPPNPKNQENIQTQIPKVSPHLQQYLEFFSSVQDKVDIQILQCIKNDLHKSQHKIVLLDKNIDFLKHISYKTPRVQYIGQLQSMQIIKYQVIIAIFKMTIELLNIKGDAPKNKKSLGEGGCGIVFSISIYQYSKIACKRKIFNSKDQYKFTNQNNDQQAFMILPNQRDIKDAICEYSILKICSFYRIGPFMGSPLGFDLVCYDDAIQFFMEQCIDFQGTLKDHEEILKKNIRLLHKLNIIHKDIKPTNILYSVYYKKVVLSDFGISYSIQEKLGQLTQSYLQGTAGYMSLEMSQLKNKKKGKIDLYYNDLVGLKVSLGEMSRKNGDKSKFDNAKCKLMKKAQNIDFEYSNIVLFYLLVTVADDKDILSHLKKVNYNLNWEEYPFKSRINSRLIKLLQNLSTKQTNKRQLALKKFIDSTICENDQENYSQFAMRIFIRSQQLIQMTISNKQKLMSKSNKNRKLIFDRLQGNKSDLCKLLGHKYKLQIKLEEYQLYVDQKKQQVEKKKVMLELMVKKLDIFLESLSSTKNALQIGKLIYEITQRFVEFKTTADYRFCQIFKITLSLQYTSEKKKYENQICIRIQELPNRHKIYRTYLKVIQICINLNLISSFYYFCEKVFQLIKSQINRQNYIGILFTIGWQLLDKGFIQRGNDFLNQIRILIKDPQKNKCSIEFQTIKLQLIMHDQNYVQGTIVATHLKELIKNKQGQNSIKLAHVQKSIGLCLYHTGKFDTAALVLTRSQQKFQLQSQNQGEYYINSIKQIKKYLNYINLFKGDKKKYLDYIKNESQSKLKKYLKNIQYDDRFQQYKINEDYIKYEEQKIDQLSIQLDELIQIKKYDVAFIIFKIIYMRLYKKVIDIQNRKQIFNTSLKQCQKFKIECQFIQDQRSQLVQLTNQIQKQIQLLLKYHIINIQIYQDFQSVMSYQVLLSRLFFIVSNHNLKADVYQALANRYERQCLMELAIHNLLEQYKLICGDDQNPKSLICAHKLGLNFLSRTQQYGKGIYFFKKIVQKNPKYKNIINILSYISQCYYYLKKYSEALKFKIKWLTKLKINEKYQIQFAQFLIKIKKSCLHNYFITNFRSQIQVKQMNIIQIYLQSTKKINSVQDLLRLMKDCKYIKKMKRIGIKFSKYDNKNLNIIIRNSLKQIHRHKF